jgi:hypothetical protein
MGFFNSNKSAIFLHDRRYVMNNEEKTDICKSCGKIIGAAEQAIVVEDGLLCIKCEQRLSDTSNIVSRDDSTVELKTVVKWVFQMFLGIILVIDLIIMILPQPPTPHYEYSFGGQRLVSSYSSTGASIQKAKDWADLYLNPVGWAAIIYRGIEMDTVYQLRRDESWESALGIGRIISFLVGVSFLFLSIWLFGQEKTRRNAFEVLTSSQTIEELPSVCKSCGRTISSSEMAIVVDGGLFCFQCDQKNKQ